MEGWETLRCSAQADVIDPSSLWVEGGCGSEGVSERIRPDSTPGFGPSESRDGSIQYMESGAELYPNHLAFRNNLGWYHFLRGNYEVSDSRTANVQAVWDDWAHIFDDPFRSLMDSLRAETR